MAIPQDPLTPTITTVPDPAPQIEGPLDEAISPPEQISLFEDDSDVQPPIEAVEPVPVTTDDPTQVAGLWTTIKGVAKKAAKKIEEAEPIGAKPPEEPITRVGDFWVVKEASDQEVAAYNSIIGVTEGKPPSVAINYDRMVGTNSELETFDKIAQVYKEYIDKQKRGSITFLETIKAAQRKIDGGVIEAVKKGGETVAKLTEGGVDGILDLLFKRNIGQPINAEDLIAGRLALAVINRDVTLLQQKITAGIATEADKIQFRQAMAIEGAAMASLLGGRAEAARTTAAGRIVADISQTRADEITRLLTEGGDQTVEWLAQRYAILPTAEAKAQFSRGIRGKMVDVWQTIFLNAYLSGLTTQAVNIAGNTGMAMLQVVERLGAELIGGTRRSGAKLLKKGVDKFAKPLKPGQNELPSYLQRTSAFLGREAAGGVQRGEAIEMLHGLIVGTPQALRLMLKSYMLDMPQSGGLTTKLDIRGLRNPITGENLLSENIRNFGIGPIANLGRAVDALGVIYTHPGRVLMSVDEFFKAWNQNAQLHALSLRRMKQNITAGMSPKDAKVRYEVDMRDPPADLLEEIREFADISTFTNELEGALGNLQTTMSHPAMKIAVPFFKTPTNIGGQTLQRAGPLALASPKFRKLMMSADPADRDLAMSRLAIGSTIMGTFAMMAAGNLFDDDGNLIDDITITGSGPTARGSKDAFRRQKLQPYSICERVGSSTKYSCVSYARFDPISGLLAMAGDYADYARYSDDKEELELLATAAALAVENYIDELPMLQGMVKIGSEFGRSNKDGAFLPGLIDTLVEMTASTILEPGLAIMTTGTNYSSLIASIERMQDPTVKDTTPDPNLPIVFRGFYAALLKAKSRNPWFSDEVPDRLNLWAETTNAGEGRAWELFSPIRIQEAEFNRVDTEIQRLNFFVGGRLTMTPFKKVNGVKLTTLQKNALIRATNEFEINGIVMKDAFLKLIDSDRYYDLSNEDKIKEMGNIVTTYRGSAGTVPPDGSLEARWATGGIKTLLEGDIDLEEKVMFRDLPPSKQRELKAQGRAP